MGVRIERLELPGIGTRHDIVTENGRRIGVVTHRSGGREIALYDITDPDAASDSIHLSEPEAAALADILGVSVLLGQLSSIQEQAAGLSTVQVVLDEGSPFVGRVLGDTKARTRTGTSIVAILRGSQVIPSPTPSTTLFAGDTIIAVGTADGTAALAEILANDTE